MILIEDEMREENYNKHFYYFFIFYNYKYVFYRKGKTFIYYVVNMVSLNINSIQ